MSTKAREAFWNVALGNNTKLANLAKLAIQEAENEPKREWVGLTDEEILGLIGIHVDDINDIDDWQEEIREVRAIEAKLKEKNT
jgi:hypothetical protein